MRRSDGLIGDSRRVARLIVVCGIALAAIGIGCADRGHASTVPGRPYSQTAVAKCLLDENVAAVSVNRRNLNPIVLKKFPAMTGTLGIAGGRVRVRDGVYKPLIDFGALIFEKSERDARHDAAGVYAISHDPRINPLGQPAAPSRFIPAVLSTRGSVIIYWDYPRHHPVLSSRLIRHCLPPR